MSLLLRAFLGPQASRRAYSRLWGLRYEAIPALRHRAQGRIYQAVVQQLTRLEKKRKSGKGGFVSFLVGNRRRRGLLRSGPAVQVTGKTATNGTLKEPMSQYGLSSSPWERGGRRKKVYDYIKAANDLRQSYTSQLTTQISNAARDYNDSGYDDTPGAFPDVEIARHGDEEMVLFPSYARRISRKTKDRIARQRRESTSSLDEYHRGSDDIDEPESINWEEYEMENAVVTIDVRGWMYSPHRGPMTRKNRLMIALARRLSGVPAPTNNPADNSGSTVDIGSNEKITSQREDELVNKEMQSMISKAESEADAAWKSSARDNRDEGAAPGTPTRRTTTAPTDPSQLTKDELSLANAHLMERLRPFLANPMAEMPVTVFFFNEDQSQSRNTLTDASGHFTLRAALPFVPTHIRVLGSENLSAAKEVRIVEPNGVSLISDIDDTVKHSAIANGAKEMFRNTFVRELSELVVSGVNEWYTDMAKMGIEIHYVSNAPWQLYPLLERFFKMAGLPPGSFHLKQYNGMLQGIFEPTAERKRASLERIMEDFPERKFVLVGDSGEADLEVYTDIVLANPGRILGIFIRDVTTSDHALFFEKSVDHARSATVRSHSTSNILQDHGQGAITNRPTLPPRRPVAESLHDFKSIDNADLIDLRDEEETPKKPDSGRPPPAKPSKPQTLRTTSSTAEATSQEAARRKPVPPVPRRAAASSVDDATRYGPDRNVSPAPTRSSGQTEASARSKRAAPPPPPPRRTNTGTSTPTLQSSNSNSNSNSETPPASERQQSYPAAAASAAFQYASYASDRLWQSSPSTTLRSAASSSNINLGRTSNTSANDQQQQDSGFNSSVPQPPLPNRREELWRRRWERASEILEQKGVVLGSWRVGSDVQDVCIWLTKEALEEMQEKSTKDGGALKQG